MKTKLIISSLSVLMLFACNKLKLQPNDYNTLSSGTVENTGATISSTYTPVCRGGRQNFETVQNC